MPLGIISDEAFEKELENLSKRDVRDAEVKELPTRGRKEEVPNIPKEIRKTIADCAVDGESRKVIAGAFGISEPTVTNIKNGYGEVNQDVQDHVKTRREKITSRASSKLMTALRELTPAKIADASAREISGIAKDMSQVIRNLEPQEKGTSVAGNFVFFAPSGTKQIADYEVINAKD
jgi:hypothetical protein